MEREAFVTAMVRGVQDELALRRTLGLAPWVRNQVTRGRSLSRMAELLSGVVR